jgi:hypothetical protein
MFTVSAERKKGGHPVKSTALKPANNRRNGFISRLRLWGKMASLRFSLHFLACKTKGADNLHLRRLLKACSLLLLLVTPVWSSPRTTRETEIQRFENRYHNVRSRMEISRTLSFLKGRLENQPSLLEKITKKLSNLNEEQAHLIVSLCDRVNEAGETAGADAAFLLMTVLLIVS